MKMFQYCPMCGERYQRDQIAGFAHHCFACDYTFYEGQKATVGGLIRQGKKVLLARRAIDPGKDLWDIPGGFVEPEETLIQALHREILEELGAKVISEKLILVFSPTKYVYKEKEQSNCDHFYEVIVEGELSAQDDVSELKWFEIEEIPFDKLAFESVLVCLRNLRK